MELFSLFHFFLPLENKTILCPSGFITTFIIFRCVLFFSVSKTFSSPFSYQGLYTTYNYATQGDSHFSSSPHISTQFRELSEGPKESINFSQSNCLDRGAFQKWDSVLFRSSPVLFERRPEQSGKCLLSVKYWKADSYPSLSSTETVLNYKESSPVPYNRERCLTCKVLLKES